MKAVKYLKENNQGLVKLLQEHNLHGAVLIQMENYAKDYAEGELNALEEMIKDNQGCQGMNGQHEIG